MLTFLPVILLPPLVLLFLLLFPLLPVVKIGRKSINQAVKQHTKTNLIID